MKFALNIRFVTERENPIENNVTPISTTQGYHLSVSSTLDTYKLKLARFNSPVLLNRNIPPHIHHPAQISQYVRAENNGRLINWTQLNMKVYARRRVK
jgi:hypothetical protein